LWTTIGKDWMWDGPQVAEHVLQDVGNGSIICLHDGRKLSPEPNVSSTLDALRVLIPSLKARGFHFETVSQITSFDSTECTVVRAKYGTGPRD
jgi:peptidoglycan/xylan/chitin deacetylase (PgdA/CDA1 family)